MSRLFIRSQNKTLVLKVNEIRIKERVENNANLFNGYKEPKVVGYEVLVNDIPVALYQTNERAMQVLDEICVALSGKVIAQPKSTSKAKEKVGTVGENDSVELKTLNCDAFYQMPQE